MEPQTAIVANMSYLDTVGHTLIGVGVYTVAQAARLVRLPVATVDLVVGPEPDNKTPLRAYPVAVAELDLGFGDKIVTFRGLMELWVAARLREAGITWPMIRFAACQAARILNTRYPLSEGRFRTEGNRVFLSLGKAKHRPKTVINLLSRQQEFEDVIERSLGPDIAVRDRNGLIQRLFPLGLKCNVVLDPGQRFGEPTDPDSGVPTASLAEAYHAENGNVAAAAQWFDTSKKAVRDAIRFEEWLNSV
jgi:uncharacterized protein (DUF433 family)